MSKTWYDSLDDTMDFSKSLSWLDDGKVGERDGSTSDTPPPVADATSASWDTATVSPIIRETDVNSCESQIEHVLKSMMTCVDTRTGDSSCTGLSAGLGEPIISNRVISGFTLTYLKHDGFIVDTREYTARISLPNDAPIDAVMALYHKFDESASPIEIYTMNTSHTRMEVRVSFKSVNHSTRVIEMDWDASYQMCIRCTPDVASSSCPNPTANMLIRSISINDLDMRGCISLCGYLHSLWSTTMVRFLTNAYNQYKTLKWSASLSDTSIRAVEGLKVRSQVGKTNFTVNVAQNDETVCEMSGHWARSFLLENESRYKAAKSTQVAPSFRMRGISDAIRHVSILHGLLFGGMSHQLELASTEKTVVVLSSLLYDMYKVRSNVDLHPQVTLLEVVNDQEFHVRMLYYDSDGTLFMSSNGRWVSVDKETSKAKPLPKTSVAIFRQFFENSHA